MKKLVDKLMYFLGEVHDPTEFIKATKGDITLGVDFLILNGTYPVTYSFRADKTNPSPFSGAKTCKYFVRDKNIKTVGQLTRMSHEEFKKYIDPKLDEKQQWMSRYTNRDIRVLYHTLNTDRS